MKFKRKLSDALLKWKNESRGHRALLIEGARRVGKSTIAKQFAENEYRSYILVDFNIAPKNIKDNFENLNRLDIFFQNLSLEYNTKLYNRESLIIFDEIQKFPKAREAVKYLVADGRYDYLETGSLISIRENVKDITIPSEETKIKMYPLDFEEFAQACNEELLLAMLCRPAFAGTKTACKRYAAVPGISAGWRNASKRGCVSGKQSRFCGKRYRKTEHPGLIPE